MTECSKFQSYNVAISYGFFFVPKEDFSNYCKRLINPTRNQERNISFIHIPFLLKFSIWDNDRNDGAILFQLKDTKSKVWSV